MTELGNERGMNTEAIVRQSVNNCYWKEDLNCATTTLLVLAGHFGVTLAPQVLDAALGMHGAGGFRAQCGLVEGALMFSGILGRSEGISDEKSVAFCMKLAEAFEGKFGSLQCRTLRPEGFHPDNPPHLCEGLTVRATCANIDLISEWIRPSK